MIAKFHPIILENRMQNLRTSTKVKDLKITQLYPFLSLLTQRMSQGLSRNFSAIREAARWEEGAVVRQSGLGSFPEKKLPICSHCCPNTYPCGFSVDLLGG